MRRSIRVKSGYEHKAATTATPDDSPVTAKPTPPPPEVLDEIERKIRAGVIPMTATLADVLPDDETRNALWGCCAKPKHLQPTFTDLMMRNHQPWIAANPKLWDAAYEAEADALDTIFCKNLKAPCNQPPLFRTPLADFYNITETAQPTTAQAADGDAIARKVADAVGSQLKYIATNTDGAKIAAERAAAGIDELAAEMKVWREWVRELAKHPDAKPSEPNLCAVVQGKICEIWQGFKNAPADCELPSGAFRKTKRTFAECLALHGHDEVWHGKRLIDFIPDEKTFERVVHNGTEKARQAKTRTRAKPPKPQKRKTQARRKK